MWTPRRVLLLILGVVLFGAAFGVYLRFLGWIDGLPQLPDEFLARRAETEPFPEATLTPVEKKLQLAFPGGGPWHEIAYPHKIEIPAKKLVLAFIQFHIEADGRVKFTPFSLATFKDQPDGFPEVNTVHCDVAYMEFDKPVKTLSEIGSRRIVAFELASDPHLLSPDPRRGLVHVQNNRGTPTPDDDLVVESPGPVNYREAAQTDRPLDQAQPQIRTAAAVRLVDRRGNPQATTITAQGMLVYLAVDPPGPATAPDAKRKDAPKPAAHRGTAVSGVRRVVLPGNVRMDLWMDPKDGFLAGGEKKAAPSAAKAEAAKVEIAKAEPAKPEPAKAAPPERTNVQITTLGPFVYDLRPEGDRARFDRLPPTDTKLADNCVRVVRPLSRGDQGQSYDQLECDSLEMQFSRRPGAPAPAGTGTAKADKPKPPAEADRSAIDWVHAWGQDVLLTSDDMNLVARGNDLFHDAHAKTNTLRGAPETVAIKDSNEIHAPELVLYGEESKEGQQALARGAGYFRMFARDDRPDTEVKKEPAAKAPSPREIVARWRDHCVYRKEDTGHSLLTLVGGASFEDRANSQLLGADQIKLRLLEPREEPKPPTGPSAHPGGRAPAAAKDPGKPPRPEWLDAVGHVYSRSPELNIHDTEQLMLLFRDAPAPPASTAVAAAPPAGARESDKPSLTAPPASTPAAGTPAKSAAPAPPPRPIDLRARRVDAFVNVFPDGTKAIDSVHCEEGVRVHQDPPTPQEKPVDMLGKTIDVKHTPEGNILTVTGTLNAFGQVHLPDLSLLGPNIEINQIDNTAVVSGMGSMRMTSTTNFQGEKLEKPSDLIITWKQKMMFQGQSALFEGHVQAEQNNSVLLCEVMQVFLSQTVSLNDRARAARGPGAAPATVDKVVCDAAGQPQGVIITDYVRDKAGDPTEFKHIQASEVAMIKEERKMDAGRGVVRLSQLGPKGELGGPAAPPAGKTARPQPPVPGKPVELEWKLTWVRYDGRMLVNDLTKTVTFYRNIDVLHLPVARDDPSGMRLSMDRLIDRPPPGTMYLRCHYLQVHTTRDGAGHNTQEMVAREKAWVQWQGEFTGAADVIKYDEAKQVVILEGSKGNPASVVRLRRKPDEPRQQKAEKFIYNRLTEQWDSINTYWTSND